MDEETLSKLIKYDEYLASRINKLSLARYNEDPTSRRREIAEARREEMTVAQNKLYALFPEIRAQESQLAQKTQCQPPLYLGVGEAHKRIIPKEKRREREE